MTDPRIPVTTNATRGYVRFAAHSDEPCPKCGAVNPNDRQVSVWRVSDERGLHWQCDVCAHEWRLQVERVPLTDAQRAKIAAALESGRAERE